VKGNVGLSGNTGESLNEIRKVKVFDASILKEKDK